MESSAALHGGRTTTGNKESKFMGKFYKNQKFL